MNISAEGQRPPARFPITNACVAATAALGPAYLVRWHYGFYPTTLLETAIAVTVAAFAIESWRAGERPAWRTPLTLPAIGFLVAGAISVLVAPSFVAALGLYRAYIIEPILLALVVVNAVRTPRQGILVVAGFCAGATVLAAANIENAIHALVTHTFQAAASPPSAIYPVANSVALYLVPLVALTASLALHGGDSRLRIGFGAVAGVITLASLLTFSRGGWLALVAVALSIALSHRRRWILVGGLLAVGVVVAFIPPIHARWSAFLTVDPTAGAGERTVLWANTIRMLLGRPLFGAGLYGFYQAMGPANIPYGLAQIYPNNIFLNFWSETGLLGLASFTAIFVIAMVASWRGWRAGDAAWRPIQLGIFVALVAIFVHGLVDVPYFKNDLAMQFWLLVGISLAGRYQRSGVAASNSRSAASSSRPAIRR